MKRQRGRLISELYVHHRMQHLILWIKRKRCSFNI
nr:MAG TPA: Melittin [Caudoviricetes sp.]